MRPELRNITASSPYVFTGGDHPTFEFAMGQLAGEMKGLRSDIHLQREEHEDVDKRVRSLEKSRWIEAGAVSLASFLGSGVMQWVIYMKVIHL